MIPITVSKRGRGYFFRWVLKTARIKNTVWKSQAKKKQKDSNCSFYNFSLLVPYPNKLLVVFICIIIFHSIYSLQPSNFFQWGLNFFFVSCSQGLGIFQIFWERLYWGLLISFLGEEDQAIFFYKTINDQSCKLKNS